MPEHEDQYLYQVCPSCGGDKIIDQTAAAHESGDPVEWVEVECTRCDPNGMIIFGELNNTLIDRIQDTQTRAIAHEASMTAMQSRMAVMEERVGANIAVNTW